VIIGAESSEAIELMREIYAPFMLNRERLFIMDIASSELTKYAANIMLASRISLMNELASLCEKVGGNIDKVRQGIGSDSRIGYQFLYAGAGYGGSCLPKDVKAMIALSKKLGVRMELLEGIDHVNMRQKYVMFKKIETYFENLKGKKFAILGLSFKPDTDDIREASAITLIEELLKAGATLSVFDPVAMDNTKRLFPPSNALVYAEDEVSACDGADAIVLMTEWKQFRFLNFDRIMPLLKRKVFFDGRNQYLPEKMQKLGFDYISIGKQAVFAEVSQC
jgi:UDPglucose 6-dehydrogenase